MDNPSLMVKGQNCWLLLLGRKKTRIGYRVWHQPVPFGTNSYLNVWVINMTIFAKPVN